MLKENETGEVNVSAANIWFSVLIVSCKHALEVDVLIFCFPPHVQWHAFSMPELKNFLRILQREEEEHVKQIVQRYALARTKMQEALAGSTPGWDDSALGG